MPRYVEMPCPRCKGPTHLDTDGKRRRKAYFCNDVMGCGWNNSAMDRNYREADRMQREREGR